MSTRASLQDMAAVKRSGMTVDRYGDAGWTLTDVEGAYLMVGDHGCVAPTQWECVAEALSRIADGQVSA